jgi:light-regulated signal transduction histidine kinase (bacteriophytochrome)
MAQIELHFAMTTSEAERDIAELRTQLRNCHASLDAAYKELDLLCHAVSHDLRAPLRAVDGFTRMLLDRAHERLDDEDRRLIDVVRGNSARMSELIEDLVRYSRLNRQAVHPASVDMAALVGEAWSALEHAPSERLDVQPMPAAFGDRVLLKQVWFELLGNALKFRAAGEDVHIEVSGERQGDECVYRVRDRGVGFDMAYAQKLFSVFQRLHAVKDFPGHGIGLASVARIVQRHGGRVGAESAPRRGATFFFALPAPRA